MNALIAEGTRALARDRGGRPMLGIPCIGTEAVPDAAVPYLGHRGPIGPRIVGSRLAFAPLGLFWYLRSIADRRLARPIDEAHGTFFVVEPFVWTPTEHL